VSLADRLAALSPQQRALFERLRRRQDRAGTRLPPPVEPVSGPLGLGDWPLSFDQERLWRLHQEDPRLVSWNVDAGSRLSGEMDLPAFLGALEALVHRHAAWRTTFPRVGGRPVQRVAERLAPEVSLIDLRALPEELREATAHRALYDHTRRPFDLGRGPLLRLALVRLAARERLLLVTIHHLVTDWITFQIFFRELLALYQALRARRPRLGSAAAAAGGFGGLPAPSVQYPDYAVWERQWLQGEVLAEEARFWRQQLAGFPLVLELPADRPRPAVQSQRGGLYRVAAGAERSDRLRALARAEGATVFMALLAALHALLGRLAGQHRLLVGSNGANRARPELEAVAGFFLTQIPFAGDLSGDPSFRELLARGRRTALAAYAHQGFPFSKLVEAVLGADAEPDRGRHPIVQAVLLVLEAQGAARSAELAFQPVGLYDGNSRWDLMLGLYDDREAGLVGALEYNADIWDPPTAGRLLESFYGLLDVAVANPDARISALPATALAPGPEGGGGTTRLQVLAGHEPAPAPAPAPGPAPASARQLLELAPALRRLGVRPGAKVGLLLPPSVHRDALELAVRRLEGVAVLADPAAPAARLSALLAGADLEVLVHEGALPREIALAGGIGAVRIDVTRLVAPPAAGEERR
jgi:hypothetical protein